MRLSDIAVEVRDKNLVRLGIIQEEDLNLDATIPHSNVGTWKLTLDADHPLTSALRTPGSGVIVSHKGEVLFSGPTNKPEYTAQASDPAGTVVFDGVTDEVILAERLAYPQPGNADVTTQTVEQDERTGPAETLMHQFVNLNIGPGASATRKIAKLTMGANGARGASTTKSAKFTVLGNLLNELASAANLGFRVVQVGANLQFQTYAVTDNSAAVRLTLFNNGLASQKIAQAAPSLTRAIVAGGQEDAAKRTYIEVTTADSTSAETAWGRRIEQFVDGRGSADPTEMNQSGLEALANGGSTSVAVQAMPTEDSPFEFGVDWNLGDQVMVEIDGSEVKAVVASYVLKIGPEGVRFGITLGEDYLLSGATSMTKAVSSMSTRISALERNLSAAPALSVEVKNTADIPSATHDGHAVFDRQRDILKVYDQVEAGWESIGVPTRITASTRPASPEPFALYYETDTGRLVYHNGTAWHDMAATGTSGRLSSSSEVTLSTTATILPGTSSTRTFIGTGHKYLVIGVFDFQSSASGGTAVGELYVDGSPVGSQAVFSPVSSGARATVSQTWLVTGLSAGPHTMDLRASKADATGSIAAKAGHSAITILPA